MRALKLATETVKNTFFSPTPLTVSSGLSKARTCYDEEESGAGVEEGAGIDDASSATAAAASTTGRELNMVVSLDPHI
ncbi:unnamed protein product [Calypogeia fissa]